MPHAADRYRVSIPGAFRLALGLWALTATATAGTLTITTQQRNARPLAGAVVMLESESGTDTPAPPVQAVMDQKGLAFVPDVLVLPVRSSVAFPNSDAVSHQVYSFSGAKTFQLPLYRGRPYPPVVFDQPGVVTLGCNIHDHMLAYIVVTRAPHFGRTDEQGRWVSPDLPAGRYLVRVWHPLLNENLDGKHVLTVGTSDVTLLIRLTRNLRPAPITGRPQSWDY
jgi:plastocyanin